MRSVLFVAAALALPLACGKKKERAPLAPGVTSAPGLPPSLQAFKELGSSSPNPASPPPDDLAAALEAAASTFASTSAVASGSPSSSGSASASVSASTSVSASASASAPAPGPLAARLVGLWGFAAFDLTHPDTKTKWDAIPKDMQKEILAEAPKASIEFTPQKLISRLAGVPDKSSTWAIESETDSELTIKTSDDGRKKIRFPMEDAMRIEELDKKGAFVTLFARRKPGAAAPSTSASK